MGKSLVFLVLLAACSFDSQTDSVGGNSLGDGDDTTGGSDGVSSSPTSASTASASASGTTMPSTTTPSTSDTSAMTSESETDPVAETGEATTTAPDTTTSESESESRTTSESMTSDDTMMATTEMPTTGMPEELYPPCFDGECPPDHQCRQYSSGGDPVAFSICTPLDCTTGDDCPDPIGDAERVCVGNMPTFCQLDCEADMGSCPTGMDCVWVSDIDVYRCLWPD